MEIKDIIVEALGFDFQMIAPNMVHLDENKVIGLTKGDDVRITCKRGGETFRFRVRKTFFNGFEYYEKKF